MISYSSRAAKAIAHLKRSYNDVDIYVGDTGGHNMWFCLIRRILPPDVKFRSVNILGNKEKVIEACRSDQGPSDRKRLYVIDGDFDYALGRPKPRLRHLYRLRAYCVENILLSEDAILEMAMIAQPKESKERLSARLDYPKWIAETYKSLHILFQIYAASEGVRSGVQTVKYSVQKLLVQKERLAQLDAARMRSRIFEVARLTCREVGFATFFNQLKKVRKHTDKQHPGLFISGKDYLLPLIRILLQKAFSIRHSMDQIKVALATGFSYEEEPYLSRRVRGLCR